MHASWTSKRNHSNSYDNCDLVLVQYLNSLKCAHKWTLQRMHTPEWFQIKRNSNDKRLYKELYLLKKNISELYSIEVKVIGVIFQPQFCLISDTYKSPNFVHRSKQKTNVHFVQKIWISSIAPPPGSGNQILHFDPFNMFQPLPNFSHLYRLGKSACDTVMNYWTGLECWKD